MVSTKKDFKKVAEILKRNISFNVVKDGYTGKILEDDNLLKEFCEYFKSKNPNFDEQKFRDAILK